MWTRDGGTGATGLPDVTSEIFLPAGLDDPNQLEIARKIRFCAQRFFAPRNAFSRSRRTKMIKLICPSGNRRRDAAKSLRDVAVKNLRRTLLQSQDASSISALLR
jgi:rhodanese-related sulfurtransferase